MPSTNLLLEVPIRMASILFDRNMLQENHQQNSLQRRRILLELTMITPIGEPSTPRAAHDARAVGTVVVIQGGIGPASLSAEDLHVLDLTQQRPRWHRVVVQGLGPGPRYGHVMALVGQRYLMCIGGNDGKRPLADVWALDTAAKPYEWRKLEPEGEAPPPCMSPEEKCLADFGIVTQCMAPTG